MSTKKTKRHDDRAPGQFAPAEIGKAAAFSAGMAAGQALFSDLIIEGRDVDLAETVKHVAIDAAIAGAHTAAVKTVEVGLEKAVIKIAGEEILRESGKQVAKQAAKLTAGAAAKAALRTNIIGQVAALIVDQGVDTGRLAAGNIDGAEYGKRTVENVGGAAGSLGGTVGGAALGTLICPGVGTVIGGIVGGIIGSLGGTFGAKAIVR
jgi:hypothetical protein